MSVLFARLMNGVCRAGLSRPRTFDLRRPTVTSLSKARNASWLEHVTVGRQPLLLPVSEDESILHGLTKHNGSSDVGSHPIQTGRRRSRRLLQRDGGTTFR